MSKISNLNYSVGKLRKYSHDAPHSSFADQNLCYRAAQYWLLCGDSNRASTLSYPRNKALLTVVAKPFFPTLLVAGAPINFDHLEPFQFLVATEARPGGATIDVRFSNHCFSESFDTAIHAGSIVDVWDRGLRRVFSQQRYDLSLGLRDIIEALPTSPIFLTPEANFVRVMIPGDHGIGEYRVYFNAKHGRDASDVSLFIESAYPPDFSKPVLKPSQMTKVRFSVLVDKTIRGEKIKFQYKR